MLVETFADTSRSDGACYRAANWLGLGETRGGKGKAPKRVYVYPLAADFREVLLHGPQRTAPRRKATPRAAPALTADDPFLLAWQELVGAATAAATAHDRVWRLRRRLINTVLVVLFVYRLMFSGNGYTATLAALWEQCQACGIPLPQAEPAAASSMSAARAEVDEDIFKSLHAEILKRAGSPEWKGHRVFAVDGSKINLPRPLLRAGYRLPQERAHYPQGLLSCFYELVPKLPIDFDLHAHGNERAAALAHLPAMAAGDVVVYDRGYYSYRMLLAHAERGVHPLFRLQRNAGTAFDDFIAGSTQDELTTITPGPDTLRRLRRKDPEAEPRPISPRLVKYVHGGTEFYLATTLLDRSRYSVQDLADLYHDRWGSEELYKTSKRGFELENFVRRGKALSSGGCEPRPTAVAPVGSSQGGLRRQRCRLKHSGDEGPRMAAQQPCGPEREVNAEQASKQLTQKPTLRCLGEGRWQIGKRATYAPICICRGSGASTHGR